MKGGIPERGDVFHDSEERELTITSIVLDDPLGRQVRGRLLTPDGEEADYACDLRTFVPIWLERKPMTPYAEQTMA